MVDTVAVTKLFESQRRVVYQFTNKSDGTGETDVAKIDISSLVADGVTPDRLALTHIDYSISNGMSVEMYFNRTADVQIGVFTGEGSVDYQKASGGLHDTGTGSTGDVTLSTVGASAGDTYNIVTQWRKKRD